MVNFYYNLKVIKLINNYNIKIFKKNYLLRNNFYNYKKYLLKK